MKFEVLGCSGSDLPGYKLTSFRINDTLLMDAGTITSELILEEQVKITDILITHAHLDHVRDILFLADNLIELVVTQQHDPVRIWGIKEVLESIKTHLLNDTIWPDFTVLPASERPVLVDKVLEPGRVERICGLNVCTYLVNHAQAASGYVVWGGRVGENLAFTGDTGPSDDWWASLNQLPFAIKNLIIEASFPDSMTNLALISKHLTPSLLKIELDKLVTKPKVFITHMKSPFSGEIQEELQTALAGYSYHLLREGEVFHF